MNAFESGDFRGARQVTAIPFRCKNEQIEFCLISASSGRWIFPKGSTGKNQDFLSAALSEAYEEAGLLGEIFSSPIGSYRISKKGDSFDVVAVLMRVTQTKRHWPESDWRRRCWVSPQEAMQRIQTVELRELVTVALQVVQQGNTDAA